MEIYIFSGAIIASTSLIKPKRRLSDIFIRGPIFSYPRLSVNRPNFCQAIRGLLLFSAKIFEVLLHRFLSQLCLSAAFYYLIRACPFAALTFAPLSAVYNFFQRKYLKILFIEANAGCLLSFPSIHHCTSPQDFTGHYR